MPGVFIAQNRIHTRAIDALKSDDLFECLGTWWAQSHDLFGRPTLLAVHLIGYRVLEFD